MARRGKLAGELLADLVGSAQVSPEPLPPRARNGGTDPESVVELLAYDIPFRTEPALGMVFPPGAVGRAAGGADDDAE